MNHWIMWVLMGGAFVFIAVAAFLAYLGFVSSVRPILVFRTAWAVAIRALWTIPRTVMGLVFVIFSGAGLQIFFSLVHGFDEQTLLMASLAWQAIMATAIAMLAVYLHLFIIHEVLAARRFGAESVFYRDESVNETLHNRPPSPKLLIQAGLAGFLIWLLGYGLHIGANAFVLVAPAAAHAVVPAIARYTDPAIVRLGALIAAAFASFLITALFALVRPALSLGAARPLFLGLEMAFKHAWALFLISALLLVAPAILGPLSAYIPQHFASGNEFARVAGVVFFALFSVIQTLAVEAATVLFINRAMNRTTERHDAAPAVAAVAATT